MGEYWRQNIGLGVVHDSQHTTNSIMAHTKAVSLPEVWFYLSCFLDICCWYFSHHLNKRKMNGSCDAQSIEKYI